MKIKLVGKPMGAPYLTPGKEYEAQPSPLNKTAVITDDEGENIRVHLQASAYPCPHARPAKWEIVE